MLHTPSIALLFFGIDFVRTPMNNVSVDPPLMKFSCFALYSRNRRHWTQWLAVQVISLPRTQWLVYLVSGM